MIANKNEICWHQADAIIKEMLRAYDVYLDLIDKTEHIHVLKEIINSLPTKLNILDIGCGTAQISLICKEHNYTGADMEHIIAGCAMEKHPENNYLTFNADTTNWNFVPDFDLVLLNAFIDVMENPLSILNNILQRAKKYVIVHRQEISMGNPTQVKIMPSYQSKTCHSIIYHTDFINCIYDNNFAILQTHSCGFANWENGGNSFLLQKIQ